MIQRVHDAAVATGGRQVAAIGQGLLVFLGVQKEDRLDQATAMAGRIAGLRIFSDKAGKMKFHVGEVNGSILVVSQLTLAANLDRGRRPSFDGAASPGTARTLYEHVARTLSASGLEVQTGVFGAMMRVDLSNDGPMTFVLREPRN